MTETLNWMVHPVVFLEEGSHFPEKSVCVGCSHKFSLRGQQPTTHLPQSSATRVSGASQRVPKGQMVPGITTQAKGAPCFEGKEFSGFCSPFLSQFFADELFPLCWSSVPSPHALMAGAVNAPCLSACREALEFRIFLNFRASI